MCGINILVITLLILYISSYLRINLFKINVPLIETSPLITSLNQFTGFYKRETLVLNESQKQSPDVFYKKDVLKSFTKFTGKRTCVGVCFNKIAGLRLRQHFFTEHPPATAFLSYTGTKIKKTKINT